MTEPIHSAADLRTQLAVEATGPNMTLIYAEHSTTAPTLTVTLNGLGDAPAQPTDDAPRVWLR